jgi:Ca2+-binding EF-hand superfamily protein
MNFSAQESDSNLQVAFAFFDDDNNGYITRSELQAALAQMGQKRSADDIAEMLEQYDLNGDGQLSFPEFVKMMEAMQPSRDAEPALAAVV